VPSLIVLALHILYRVLTHINKNDDVERKHHHIVEVGLALLAFASMPLKFWDEAF
jgi:hypothetical protein